MVEIRTSSSQPKIKAQVSLIRLNWMLLFLPKHSASRLAWFWNNVNEHCWLFSASEDNSIVFREFVHIYYGNAQWKISFFLQLKFCFRSRKVVHLISRKFIFSNLCRNGYLVNLPSQSLHAQSYQWKHQINVRNQYRFNNKDTRTSPMTLL